MLMPQFHAFTAHIRIIRMHLLVWNTNLIDMSCMQVLPGGHQSEYSACAPPNDGKSHVLNSPVASISDTLPVTSCLVCMVHRQVLPEGHRRGSEARALLYSRFQQQHRRPSAHLAVIRGAAPLHSRGSRIPRTPIMP